MPDNKRLYILYLPVIHQGYVDWIGAQTNKNVEVRVIDESIIGKLDHLRKDVRALKPDVAARLFANVEGVSKATTINLEQLAEVSTDTELYMPDDDVTDYLDRNYLQAHTIHKYPVFLRWNRNNVNSKIEVPNDSEVDYKELPQAILSLLETEALRSTDWWRRIGAIIADESEILMTSFNEHIPTQYTPYIDGDMRMSLNRGSGIELIGSEHAEAGVLASAASEGLSTKGLDLYTSTFPCPPCAKFIASAGIKRLYYEDGYAMGNGLDALKLAGTEIIQIRNTPKRAKNLDERPYPEKQ